MFVKWLTGVHGCILKSQQLNYLQYSLFFLLQQASVVWIRIRGFQDRVSRDILLQLGLLYWRFNYFVKIKIKSERTEFLWKMGYCQTSSGKIIYQNSSRCFPSWAQSETENNGILCDFWVEISVRNFSFCLLRVLDWSQHIPESNTVPVSNHLLKWWQ